MAPQSTKCAKQSAVKRAALISDLRRAVGAQAVLVDAAVRIVYSRDASDQRHGIPVCVVLPADVPALQRAIAVCARHRQAFVVRGAGTGLSGGALPGPDAVVLGTSRLTRLGPVDAERRRVAVEPGVPNEQVSRHAAASGLHFAPDPSSRSVATIGGNLGVNAGGPHCLKVGVTSQHVRRLFWIDPEGRRWTSGRGGALERGADLRGLFCGSEGTLGVICGAELDLWPVPQATATLLAEFPLLTDAAAAVVKLMCSQVVPQACEIIDAAMLQAVKAAFALPLAADVQAVMICAVAGTAAAVKTDTELAGAILTAAGARQVRSAVDPQDQQQLWDCRHKAFGALGRLAPAYISLDVVVPLAALPGMAHDIVEIGRRHRVTIAAVMHAGDGNLHPGIPYDERDRKQSARAQRAAEEIVRRALALGGSCTGEHGIGLAKRQVLACQLDRTSLRLMRGIKRLCDPWNLCNPGKLLPDDDEPAAWAKVPERIDFRWDSLTVTAPASTPLAVLQTAALARGFWIPVGAMQRTHADGPGLGGAMTVGAMIDAGTVGPSLLGALRPADAVLELWAETGDGQVLRAGAPVFKNVAGYDLVRLLVGSGGCLARPLAATLQLRPAPAAVAVWTWYDVPESFTSEGRREFLQVLRRHEQPVVVVRERQASGPSLWVVASGRDRDWDLGRLEADLIAWSEDHGFTRPLGERHPAAALTRSGRLAPLPAWAETAADWTLWSRREQRPDWPHLARLVWQAQPEMLWSASALREEPVGWFADTVFRDGLLQAPPPPAAEVPLHLLAGLKLLFDPQLRLPVWPWLRRAVAEAAGVAP